MDPDKLNLSIRKFLKLVGVSSQREVEQGDCRRHRLPRHYPGVKP